MWNGVWLTCNQIEQTYGAEDLSDEMIQYNTADRATFIINFMATNANILHNKCSSPNWKTDPTTFLHNWYAQQIHSYNSTVEFLNQKVWILFL